MALSLSPDAWLELRPFARSSNDRLWPYFVEIGFGWDLLDWTRFGRSLISGVPSRLKSALKKRQALAINFHLKPRGRDRDPITQGRS